MGHQKKALISLLLGIAIVLGIVIGQLLSFDQEPKLSLQQSGKDKIDNLLQFIKDDYVEKVNTDSIVDEVAKDIMKNLDPHSVYIPKKDVADADEALEGSFTGIGVLFQQYKDTFTIIRPIDKGPAKNAGIKAMDRILMVGKDSLFGHSVDIQKVSQKIKGKIDTKIKLKIYRKSNDSLFTVDVKRQKIPLVSVPVHFMLNDTLGLIKITSFSDNTYDEFDQSVKNLVAQGMTAMILDLRNNSGGLLKQADLISDEFLPNGKPIFFTKDKKGTTNKIFATSRGEFEKGKVFVLINENSASASEVVAGALQDNDKATIVGRRSFGKGLVQREIQLGDGSKIRLVTARYYTPTGRCIQKPYVKGHAKEYEQNFQNRLTNGELYYKDSIPIIDSLKFTTPKGKIVYGGGGIIPDVFVPLNSNEQMFQSRFFAVFLSSSITDYLDKNIVTLSKISEKEFIEDKSIGKKLYIAFKNAHKGNKNPHNSFVKKKGRKKLENLLKALLARDLYGTNAYYKILLQNDSMVQKIFEISQAHDTVE